MIKQISYRLSLLLRSLPITYYLKKKEKNPMEIFEAHIIQLERHLNNVAATLSNSKAREKILRSDLKAAIKKFEKASQKMAQMAQKKGMEYAQLIELKAQYQMEIKEFEQQLKSIIQNRHPINQSYQELRKTIQNYINQGETLKSRYYVAETKQAVYGDLSGACIPDGMSKIDNLMKKVHEMEAQAEAFFEMSPTDLKIDSFNINTKDHIIE